MDRVLFDILTNYYNTLSYTGYVKDSITYKLLVYCFYFDLVKNDYRCRLSRKDYQMIEEVLNCFYGTDCLMPYIDYLKMGKLHLGEMTEMACRVKTLEDTNVVKVMDDMNDGIPTDVEIEFGYVEEDPETGEVDKNGAFYDSDTEDLIL